MIALVWRFVVGADHRAAFECAYAPTGDWAKLFARSLGYLGTELLSDGAGTYLTIDRWRSHEDFAAFKAEWSEAYRLLDQACEGWTLEETAVGAFGIVEQQTQTS